MDYIESSGIIINYRRMPIRQLKCRPKYINQLAMDIYRYKGSVI